MAQQQTTDTGHRLTAQAAGAILRDGRFTREGERPTHPADLITEIMDALDRLAEGVRQ